MRAVPVRSLDEPQRCRHEADGSLATIGFIARVMDRGVPAREDAASFPAGLDREPVAFAIPPDEKGGQVGGRVRNGFQGLGARFHQTAVSVGRDASEQ